MNQTPIGTGVAQFAAGVGAVWLASSVGAGVTTYPLGADSSSWLAAAGPTVTTLTFAGLANGTVVTSQYADQGISFDQPGVAGYEDGYNSDGWLYCAHHHVPWPDKDAVLPTDGMRATFAAPMHSIALAHLTLTCTIQVTLYQDGEALWSGALGPSWPDQPWGAGGPWGFGGLVSDEAFDAVWITSTPIPGNNYPGPGYNSFVAIDTLMFSAIPAPGALAFLALGALTRRRCRARVGQC